MAPIDIVVNNAGVNHSADFFDISEEDWDWVMGVDSERDFFGQSGGSTGDGRAKKAWGHRQHLIGYGPTGPGRSNPLLRGQRRGQSTNQSDGPLAD